MADSITQSTIQRLSIADDAKEDALAIARQAAQETLDRFRDRGREFIMRMKKPRWMPSFIWSICLGIFLETYDLVIEFVDSLV